MGKNAAWACTQQYIPPIQASWSGEKVNSGGLTVAPCSSSSFTHSRLPAAQASHSGVLPSMLRASTWKTESHDYIKKTYLSQYHDELVTQTPAHLSTSIQQQSDTLGLSLYTRLMEGGDGVDGHNVHCRACLDQLLQLEGPALCRCLVHCWPVSPESKTMSCKYAKANSNKSCYCWWIRHLDPLVLI